MLIINCETSGGINRLLLSYSLQIATILYSFFSVVNFKLIAVVIKNNILKNIFLELIKP